MSQVQGIGNPRFDNEPAYAGLRFPDAGYQLLALYRFWNIVEYWFPYRDQLDGDWDRVLAEFVPRVALAADKDSYQLEISVDRESHRYAREPLERAAAASPSGR